MVRPLEAKSSEDNRLERCAGVGSKGRRSLWTELECVVVPAVDRRCVLAWGAAGGAENGTCMVGGPLWVWT